jgi:hypothetical protein
MLAQSEGTLKKKCKHARPEGMGSREAGGERDGKQPNVAAVKRTMRREREE